MFNIKEIEIFDVKRLLDAQHHGVKLIDVRSPMEVAAGVIPGATNIPLHLLPMSLDKIPAASEVVFYGRTGARSAHGTAGVLPAPVPGPPPTAPAPLEAAPIGSGYG